MKFLLDQGVPRTAVAALIALGHDASHTAELGLSRASDQEIINAAKANNSAIVTLDADFTRCSRRLPQQAPRSSAFESSG